MSSRVAKKRLHKNICTDSTPNAAEAGFKRPTLEKCLAATTTSGRLPSARSLVISKGVMRDAQTFPEPLVLPDDALAWDAEEPQSLRSWKTHNKETPVTPERKTIYVIPPPEITKDVRPLLVGKEKPVVPLKYRLQDVPGDIPLPTMDDLCEYLRAFYHKMDVKIYQPKFRWTAWESNTTASSGRIGLATPRPSEEVIGVGYRPSPDGIAKVQLNLNDMMDAYIERVPKDAYAMVMMTDHDLYEDEEDDFCCGRAYGGSRIAIVTSFRYHPMLDGYSHIDHEHMWPASHCQAYINDLCGLPKPPAKRAKTEKPSPPTPLEAAIMASADTLTPKSPQDYAGLWFSRTARTLSHELGHCLRFGHCVYYACVMQSTASVTEDVRQPPYLCPVCLAKLSNALCWSVGTGTTIELQKAYIKERYEVLSKYCEKWAHVGMFAGWEAWVDERVYQIDKEAE